MLMSLGNISFMCRGKPSGRGKVTSHWLSALRITASSVYQLGSQLSTDLILDHAISSPVRDTHTERDTVSDLIVALGHDTFVD